MTHLAFTPYCDQAGPPPGTHLPNNDTTRCNTGNRHSARNPGTLSGIPTPEAPMTTADQDERTKVTVVSDFI
jgi:hypothetical protein